MTDIGQTVSLRRTTSKVALKALCITVSAAQLTPSFGQQSAASLDSTQKAMLDFPTQGPSALPANAPTRVTRPGTQPASTAASEQSPGPGPNREGSSATQPDSKTATPAAKSAAKKSKK